MRLLGLVIFFCCSLSLNTWAQEDENNEPYIKQEIINARYSTGTLKALREKVIHLEDYFKGKIVGQERAISVLKAKLLTYLENFDHLSGAPIAQHLIGLSGVGKSAIFLVLEELGFKIVTLDAQNYLSDSIGMITINEHLNKVLKTANGAPIILVIDELDKIPEMVNGQEKTVAFIGMLNQILSDGKIKSADGKLDFSKVFVSATFNFSPQTVKRFSQEVLSSEKNFFNFTFDDLEKLDGYMNDTPSGRYQFLSDLFRSNTVNRIAPNLLFMNPLLADDYRELIDINLISLEKEFNRLPGYRIQVALDESLADFIFKHFVFAPSGARETIINMENVISQMVSFGIQGLKPGTRSVNSELSLLDRPRKITLRYDNELRKVIATVIPQIMRDEVIVDLESFEFAIDFNQETKQMIRPENVAMTAPVIKVTSKLSPQLKIPVLTKRSIRNARFPEVSKKAEGLAESINQHIFGQELYTQVMEEEMNIYLAQSGLSDRAQFSVLAGFPGIGKSEIYRLVAEKLNIPLVKINLQAFSETSQESAARFFGELYEKITDAREKSPRFILLLEELDKIYEINPKNGELLQRPVMAMIKDILNEGKVSHRMSTTSGKIGEIKTIDIRDSYLAFTMNFGVDLFDLQTDPRFSGVDETMRAWKSLTERPNDLQKVLKKLFLPETINRLMAHFHILKPLSEEAYHKIINEALKKVEYERFWDSKREINKAQVTLEMSESYRQYLYDETVIPSQGARYTVIQSRSKILNHIELALKNWSSTHPLSGVPVVMTLDFNPETKEVMVVTKNAEGTLEKELLKMEVDLQFPPLSTSGPMSEKRIHISVHEFGHAYAAIHLGLRIDFITVVSPQSGTGGYVSYRPTEVDRANFLISKIYSSLASRAMERIFFSKDPFDPLSALAISPGASSDIVGATKLLYMLIYELGHDPFGVTMDRNGTSGMSPYANFEDLPASEVEKLGLMLRKIENYIVADFLSAHDKTWFAEKIIALAKAGGMKEEAFYQLLEFPYPGKNNYFLGETNPMREVFGEFMNEIPEEVTRSMQFKYGKNSLTTLDHYEAYKKQFTELLLTELHPEKCKGNFTKHPTKKKKK